MIPVIVFETIIEVCRTIRAVLEFLQSPVGQQLIADSRQRNEDIKRFFAALEQKLVSLSKQLPKQ